ncbi:hypothetical protein B0A48_09872 [Cryoendolithus antarcticus]|uniref:L-dopachrome isomerase n=1 Tax=Cryoendolithus antarcticus TaxID=1507870 RepID=A0A1V8T3I4_9PEZI|nr:hypothetical protein B0A48_09872 [Cryoendolithus antarcticus]
MPHSTQVSIDTSSDYPAEGRPLTATTTTISDLDSLPSATAARKLAAADHSGSRAAQTVVSTTGLSPVSPVHPTGKRDSTYVAHAYANLIGKGTYNADRNTASFAMPDRNSVRYSAEAEAGKRRLQYYEEVFAYKENGTSSAKERVHREAPVVAELRTNVIIKDEFTLVTDLSYHLAARYTRPDSSIMINVDHSSCLALAGTFEPCYILTISTVPSQMQPVTNKRNAALIQSFMADILSVPPDRGIIKFNPIPEENLATNGNTMLGEIERPERLNAGGDGSIKRTIAEARKSMPGFASKKHSTTDARLNPLPNGIPDRTSRHERRRSNSASASPPLESPTVPNVFELAGTNDPPRPSTSHGGNTAMQNGLRLNGISKEDLVGPSTRTANGRPKTFSGRPVAADYDADMSMPLPASVSSRTERRKSAIVTPLNNPLSPKPDRSASTASTSSRGNAHKTSTLPKNLQAHTTSASIQEHSDPSTPDNAAAAAKKAVIESGTGEANTAKRRSTITATPRIPEKAEVVRGKYSVPPVPESKPARVGKRKSFLAAFRR